MADIFIIFLKYTLWSPTANADLFKTRNKIIPPLPRYLFAGCYEQKDHCKNVSEQNHPRWMLSDIVSLRNSLKKIVTNCGIANVRVLDACCVTGCKNTANIEQRLIGLKSMMAADNVHYLS
jgi:hypothetical protein